jgi:hypothetical protein
LRVQNSCELNGPAAFGGDETELFKRVGKKGPKVPFAVDDAGPRHDLSMTEASTSRVLFWIELIHAPALSTDVRAVVHRRGGRKDGIFWTRT